MPIKVLVVDDHRLVRRGIVSLLKEINGIETIGEAESGEAAIQFVRETSPDVVLMDLQMPGMGGLEATRKLLRINPDVKVLILTVCESDLFPTRLLDEGAVGYITKDCGIEEIVRAIRAVHTGQRYLSPEMAQKMALKRFTSDEISPFDNLSERELQIMMMITSGSKPQDIAESLHLSPKTVNTYRYRLFDKLGVKSDVELTLLALKYGVIEKEQ